ncbi:MAG: AAA family ATPase [Selenomonadaceae bacterium]|nr:AAA family ATPase [Selenomonadaceae bacterium]
MEGIFAKVNLLDEAQIVAAAGLQLARDGKSYICPVCGNGSHGGKGDGIKQKLFQGKLTWHCYSCGKHLSNSDVIAAAYGIEDKAALAQKLEELFPELKSENFSSSRKESARGAPEDTALDNTQLYAHCQRALAAFLEMQGGKWRGLTNETLHAAGAGYNAKYKSVILPYDKTTYFWRSVEGKERGINKGGRRRLYRALELKKTNFITEAELDALSIKQALSFYGKSLGVVATGSASFVRRIIEELDKEFATSADKPRFIVLGDNDEAGRRGATNLEAALNAAGYPAVCAYFSDGDEKVDANDYLQEHGDIALLNFLLGVVDDVGNELERRAEQIAEAARQAKIEAAQAHGIKSFSLADYMESGDFDSDLARMKKFSDRATGFENLDAAQIFLPGLYILGGAPGTGKTTFALQLLSQLARGNLLADAERCVFCSYEMSALELACKSIVREMRCRKFANKKLSNDDKEHNFSSAQLRNGDGQDSEEFKAAKEKIQSTADKLKILELSNTSIAELVATLKEIADESSEPLTIAIDYLQLIPVKNSKATARERIDEVMLALKTFQRATDTTLIVVSSLNRESYNQGGNLFSFKESGLIEYSADVTWQLARDGNSESPRQVKLKCSKNRNGATYEVTFDYYAESDYFCGHKTDEGTADKKSNRFR